MIHKYRLVSVILCALLFISIKFNLIFAQCIPSNISPTTISTTNNVVNTYYSGNANANAGNFTLSVGSKRGTAPDITDGDLLLIIQMQGVEINATLPDNLADVAGTNGDYADGNGGNDRTGFLNNTNYIAGQYEYVVANGAIVGGILNIRTPLLNTYIHNLTPTATIGARTFQVIRVANYQALILNVGASITALDWNGRTGGIVAIDVNNNFTLNGLIQANGLGFRGGARSASENVTGSPGHRGEGIAGTPRIVYNGALIQNNLAAHTTTTFTGTYTGASTYPGGTSGSYTSDRGIGAPANAGGAGFSDGGGGGGSNGGNGGLGSQDAGSNVNLISRGALNLSPAGGNRLFLGGGGGSGGREDDGGDNDAASSGQRGGGIIIIRTNTISGTGSISANGSGGNAQGLEGAGGGGAGGTILLNTSTANLSSLTIQARGGNGNNVTEANDGGGGGGGGGSILLNRIGGTFTALPTITSNGGTAGTSGANTTAAGGGSGGFSVSTLPGTSFVCDISALPISLLSFQAQILENQFVELHWITILETNNAFFSVEKSSDGFNFTEILRIDGAGNSNELRNYKAIDEQPFRGLNYYRLKQVDWDGKFTYSKVIVIDLKSDNEEFIIYPNPTQGNIHIRTLSQMIAIRILSLTQQTIFEKYFNPNLKETVLNLESLSKGIYIIEIICTHQRILKKIIIN